MRLPSNKVTNKLSMRKCLDYFAFIPTGKGLLNMLLIFKIWAKVKKIEGLFVRGRCEHIFIDLSGGTSLVSTE